MYNSARQKILKTKVQKNPFPFLFIDDLISKKDLNNLNNALPSYNSIIKDEVLYQSSSRTKASVLPKSTTYNQLNKNREFKKINSLFNKLKPVIVKKFENYINLYVEKKSSIDSLKYHSLYAVMKKGYIKSPHIDRRDHLIHILFYPSSDPSKGGEICLHKLKDKKKIFDVFPSKKNLEIKKKYKVHNNSCIIILNVPWAYHSVSMYKSLVDRKYLYMVYDFPITKSKSGSIIKNRKAGFNENQFWNNEVKVKSLKRKKVFLTE